MKVRENNYFINTRSRCNKYDPYNGSIGLSMPYNILDDNETIEYISDILTHEHIHKILHELFNLDVCKLFDAIGHLFMNNNINNTYLERFNKRLPMRKRMAWINYIKQQGFDAFLEYYHINRTEITKCNDICNSRVWHE